MSRSVPAAAFAPVLHSIVSWNCETAASYVSIQGNKLSNYFDVKQPPLKSFRTVLRQHAFPSFLCLQEVRGKADDKDYIAALRHSANDGQRAEEPYYRAYFSLCQIKGPKRFGVATYFREDVTVSKAREVDWDAEGRVLILEMPDFALVNVYALNGSEAVWKDKNGIVKGTRNERKRAFNKLLMQECLEMQQRGLRVVLVGDFNISLTKLDCHPRLRTEEPHALARKEFNDVFIPTLKVVDIYRQLHGDEPAYSWFAKGKPHRSDCARVDFALVDEKLADDVLEMRYLEREDRGTSDHAPFRLEMGIRP